MDDAELVRSAAGGSKDAFASIYERYAGRIYDFLCSTMRDRDEAADVLQETFIVAGARLGQLRDASKLRPWLYAIARHEALRTLKKRQGDVSLDEQENQVISQEPDPARSAETAELRKLVWDAAGGLNARDRAVLDLNLRQGLEGQELGDALGISASHAYTLINRLKQQVERSMGALLVTRLGRKDCEQLSAILQGWDGRFTSVIRKRVARHVDGCARCGDVRRRAVSPVSLLSAAPVFVLPDEARWKVLEQVQLVGHKTGAWGPSPDGFPPPIELRSGRRKKILFAAAAALLVAGTYLLQPGFPALSRLGGESSEIPLPAAPLAKSPAVSPVESVPALTVEPVAETTSGAPAAVQPAAPAPTSPAQISGQAATGPASGLSVPPNPSGPAAGTGSGAAGPSTGDTTAPAVGPLTVSPQTIWADGACRPRAEPTTLVAELLARDDSSIESVVLRWEGPVPGSTVMRKSGDVFSAVVGPFSARNVPQGTSVTVPLTATGSDPAGNTASSSGFFILRCN